MLEIHHSNTTTEFQVVGGTPSTYFELFCDKQIQKQ